MTKAELIAMLASVDDDAHIQLHPFSGARNATGLQIVYVQPREKIDGITFPPVLVLKAIVSA
jgi:hypothetical protein